MRLEAGKPKKLLWWCSTKHHTDWLMSICKVLVMIQVELSATSPFVTYKVTG